MIHMYVRQASFFCKLQVSVMVLHRFFHVSFAAAGLCSCYLVYGRGFGISDR